LIAPAKMSSDDDDGLTLRADTLAILQQFLKEKKEAESAHVAEASDTSATLAKTQELWQLSQFWYDAETASLLADELLAAAAERGHSETATIVLLSAPSAYKGLVAHGLPSDVRATILEFDKRFAEAFGDAFAFYDFNHPLEFPQEALKGRADVILLDPPFLNRETLEQYALTVAAMRRSSHTRVFLCSGAVMLPHARSLLGLRPVKAHIGHANQLSNPFALYVSHESSAVRQGGYDIEAEEAEARAAAASSAAAAAAAVTGDAAK
jgi:hypothetical protein